MASGKVVGTPSLQAPPSFSPFPRQKVRSKPGTGKPSTFVASSRPRLVSPPPPAPQSADVAEKKVPSDDNIHRCPICKEGLVDDDGMDMRANYLKYKRDAEMQRSILEKRWDGKSPRIADDDAVVISTCGELYHKKCLFKFCSNASATTSRFGMGQSVRGGVNRPGTSLVPKQAIHCPRCRNILMYSHYLEVDINSHRAKGGANSKFEKFFNEMKFINQSMEFNLDKKINKLKSIEDDLATAKDRLDSLKKRREDLSTRLPKGGMVIIQGEKEKNRKKLAEKDWILNYIQKAQRVIEFMQKETPNTMRLYLNEVMTRPLGEIAGKTGIPRVLVPYLDALAKDDYCLFALSQILRPRPFPGTSFKTDDLLLGILRKVNPTLGERLVCRARKCETSLLAAYEELFPDTALQVLRKAREKEETKPVPIKDSNGNELAITIMYVADDQDEKEVKVSDLNEDLALAEKEVHKLKLDRAPNYFVLTSDESTWSGSDILPDEKPVVQLAKNDPEVYQIFPKRSDETLRTTKAEIGSQETFPLLSEDSQYYFEGEINIRNRDAPIPPRKLKLMDQIDKIRPNSAERKEKDNYCFVSDASTADSRSLSIVCFATPAPPTTPRLKSSSNHSGGGDSRNDLDSSRRGKKGSKSSKKNKDNDTASVRSKKKTKTKNKGLPPEEAPAPVEVEGKEGPKLIPLLPPIHAGVLLTPPPHKPTTRVPVPTLPSLPATRPSSKDANTPDSKGNEKKNQGFLDLVADVNQNFLPSSAMDVPTFFIQCEKRAPPIPPNNKKKVSISDLQRKISKLCLEVNPPEPRPLCMRPSSTHIINRATGSAKPTILTRRPSRSGFALPSLDQLPNAEENLTQLPILTVPSTADLIGESRAGLNKRPKSKKSKLKTSKVQTEPTALGANNSKNNDKPAKGSRPMSSSKDKAIKGSRSKKSLYSDKAIKASRSRSRESRPMSGYTDKSVKGSRPRAGNRNRTSKLKKSKSKSKPFLASESKRDFVTGNIASAGKTPNVRWGVPSTPSQKVIKAITPGLRRSKKRPLYPPTLGAGKPLPDPHIILETPRKLVSVSNIMLGTRRGDINLFRKMKKIKMKNNIKNTSKSKSRSRSKLNEGSLLNNDVPPGYNSKIGFTAVSRMANFWP